MASEKRRAVRWVRATGALMVAISLAMFATMPKAPVHRNVDGLGGAVIGFELSQTPDDVFGIVGEPGDFRRPIAVAAMDRTNQIDFLFMIAYPALCVAIANLLVVRGTAPRWLRRLVVGLALAMFLGDATENRQLLQLSHLIDPASMATPLARLQVATRIKWFALFATALIEGWYVSRDKSGWRWISPVFAGAGLVGFAGVVWLPGVEAGANVLAIAWILTWVWALVVRTPATD
jgi:hypothetical protein